MNDALVQVENVTIRRGDTRILDGIDWTLRKGEQWVIVGPNGSGKTSLLNTLSGFFPPTSGKIQVLGQTYGRSLWSELRNHIGIVNHTVGDWIENRETALEIVIGGIHHQINYWGSITEADRAAALKILKRYRLAYAAGRTWNQLSQGERQRTLICRSIAAQFKLLILDEPCAGLDPVARARFLDFMDGLTEKKRGAPALMLVTHHVEEITPGFSHVLVLKNGRVQAAGRKEKVLTSKVLSEAFGAELKVRKRDARYELVL